MGISHNEYHEPVDELSDLDRDYHRALTSLQEEIEAIDWYHQRVTACNNESLSAILAHNRDEEIEHAVMVLEWLRRNMPGWDENLKTYLFTDETIVDLEQGAGTEVANGSLEIGRIQQNDQRGHAIADARGHAIADACEREGR